MSEDETTRETGEAKEAKDQNEIVMSGQFHTLAMFFVFKSFRAIPPNHQLTMRNKLEEGLFHAKDDAADIL